MITRESAADMIMTMRIIIMITRESAADMDMTMRIIIMITRESAADMIITMAIIMRMRSLPVGVRRHLGSIRWSGSRVF